MVVWVEEAIGYKMLQNLVSHNVLGGTLVCSFLPLSFPSSYEMVELVVASIVLQRSDSQLIGLPSVVENLLSVALLVSGSMSQFHLSHVLSYLSSFLQPSSGLPVLFSLS
jgi:hypothetical protein